MYSHHVSAVAQGSAGTSGAESLASVGFTLVILLLIVARRARGQELLPRKLIFFPFLPLLLGAAAVVPQLASPGSAPVHFREIDYLVLFTDLGLSAGIGSIRGFTVLIYPRNGTTWYRYGPLTALLWFLSFALRVLLGIIGAHYGALPLVTSNIVLFMLGLTLLVQNIIVIARRAGREAAVPRDRLRQGHIGQPN
jgi:hypothetical protein